MLGKRDEMIGKRDEADEYIARARGALERGLPAERLTVSIATEHGGVHRTLFGGEGISQGQTDCTACTPRRPRAST